MMVGIFAAYAMLYWERLLSVIPIALGTKRPPILKWSGYCNNLPPEAVRQNWLNRYAENGIGLLLGMDVLEGFRIGAIDVDRDELVGVVEAILGNPPCGKRGKKGVTYFVRTPVDQKLKSTTIKNHAKEPVIDVLLSGKMTVIPPSLHPETGEAYQWLGKELLTCTDDELPILDLGKLQLLKEVIGSECVPSLLQGSGTHDDGLRLVAKLVAFGCDDDQIVRIICALLPAGYQGNSREELPGWIESARAKGFDALVGRKDGSPTQLLVNIALKAAIEFFHDGDNAFASVPIKGGVRTHRIGSTSFQQWLRHQAYLLHGKPVGRGPLYEAIATLEARTLYEGECRPIHIRIGGDATSVEVDLGRADGRVVRITAEGWTVAPAGHHRFYRASGFQPLPDPVPDGDLSPLQELLGLDDHNFALLVAFLVNALKPTGPYFVLLVEGEQGSGKSFFCHVIKMLIDPNKASKLQLPENSRDLMIHAKDYRLLSYDNASGMSAAMSDALCSLATGGGIAVRRLYTDDELHVLTFERPFIINGISGYARRPDLLERAIPIKLQPMPADKGRDESEMLAELERIMPQVLGALYSAVASALKNYAVIDPPRGLRMADAARWVAAAEPAVDVSPGQLLRAVTAAQNELVAERINDDALVIRIRNILGYKKTQTFEGYVGELFADLDAAHDRTLPKSPSHLSAMLDRLRPAMAKVGLIVEFLPKDRVGRKIRITSTDRLPTRPVR